MEIDRRRWLVAGICYLGVKHKILDFDLAKSIDGAGHPSQERRNVRDSNWH
jgi:hypothetical protein